MKSDLASCFYVGDVHHIRRTPVVHAFHYRLFQLFLDLDEINEVFAGRWFWSARGWSIAEFRRSDHLGSPDRPLVDCVRELVAKKLGRTPDGPIRLLTHLRYFGYVMNPVSFYYCYNKLEDVPVALVAEVNNTPWGEQHCYVLDWRGQQTLVADQPKEFHVSPFMDMNMEYRWTVSSPEENLSVGIANFRDQQQLFEATLNLRRLPLSTWNMSWVLLRFPMMTLRVFTAIYWQALLLWWKRVPYVPHPGKADDKHPNADAAPAGFQESAKP